MLAADHRDCTNPLWPCAMTGAVACLAGLEDLAVVVHGSSGCYFYPASLIGREIHGTFLLEREVIFGTEPRLREVIEELRGRYGTIAVVNTCVPAIMGEDLQSMLDDHDVLVVDSPGFIGDFERGYRRALARTEPAVDPSFCGVNIDGVTLADPFHHGNALEARRLLGLTGASVGTTFCLDRYAAVHRAALFTVGTNPDLASGVGEWCGSLLGLDTVIETFETLASVCTGVDARPVFREVARAEQRIEKACSKYLRRFDPPRTAIFSEFAYAAFAAETLERYLDVEIACIGSRNEVRDSGFPAEQVTDFTRIRDMLLAAEPDLILGSSYERTVLPGAAFVGLTPPVRGRVLLRSRPLAGVEGTLWLMDEVLNACMDRRRRGSRAADGDR